MSPQSPLAQRCRLFADKRGDISGGGGRMLVLEALAAVVTLVTVERVGRFSRSGRSTITGFRHNKQTRSSAKDTRLVRPCLI